MTKKIIIALTSAILLTACVATPRIDIPNTLSFNYQPPSQAPMSYNDILCCYDCQV